MHRQGMRANKESVKIMAKLIKTDGTIINVYPQSGKRFTENELRDLIGGPCEDTELVTLKKGAGIMHLDAWGKFNGQPLNVEATRLFEQSFRHADLIMGNVVVTSRKELKRPKPSERDLRTLFKELKFNK